MGRFLQLSVIAAIMLHSVACSHIMSEEIKLGVDPSISIKEIKENPKMYLGKLVILGGSVISFKNSSDGGQIEVIEYKLNEEGYPDEGEGSGGKFLIISPTHLDETLYRPSALLTVIGEFKGTKSLSKWEIYPILAIRNIHVWESEEKHHIPFQVPGTPLTDPYYHGHDAPLDQRRLIK